MGESVRVLAVGDSGELLDSLARQEPITVVAEASMVTAADRLEDVGVDCLVVFIPDTDARSTAIDFLRSHTGNTPCIAVTDGTGGAELLEAGATDYVRTDEPDTAEVLTQRVLNNTSGSQPFDPNEQFVDLFENFPEPTIAYGFEGKEPVFRSVNTAFTETFGFDPSHIIGKNIRETIIPDESEVKSEDLDRPAAPGQRHDTEVRRLTASGKRLFHLTNVLVDAPGAIDGYAVYTDITERKAREREQERYKKIVETMPVGLLLLDEQKRILTLNDQLTQLLEGASTDWIGGSLPTLLQSTRLGDTITEEYLQHIEETLQTAPERDTQIERTPGGLPVFTEDITVDTTDGAQYYNLRVSAIDIGEEFDDGCVVLLQDITEKKRREEQLREREQTLEEQKADLETQKIQLQYQNDQLDKFAGIVSHDLRNPLNVATARLDLLSEIVEGAAEPAIDRENLEQIENALTRMGDIIDDALALARQGRAITETTAVSLDETVEDAWGTVATGNATLELCKSVDVESDRDRLLTVFENLFRNAIEHASDFDPDESAPAQEMSADAPDSVTVRVGLLGDGFYIEDDGPGIPDEKKEQVFEEGFTTTREGTGFGLAIVKDIVRAHGWDISVTDSESGGARFEIRDVIFSWTKEDLIAILAESLGEKKATDLVTAAMKNIGTDRTRFTRSTATRILDAIVESEEDQLVTVAAKTATRQLDR